MQIRKTERSDIPRVMEIINYGKQLQKESGNLEQWRPEYPLAQHIEADIERGESYVCLTDDQDSGPFPSGTIVATMCILESPEPTYAEIKGAWPHAGPYVTIHRLASMMKGSGSFCVQYALDHFPTVRIDTHEKNQQMLALIEKKQFRYCGVVKMLDGSLRNAYQYDRINSSTAHK